MFETIYCSDESTEWVVLTCHDILFNISCGSTVTVHGASTVVVGLYRLVNDGIEKIPRTKKKKKPTLVTEDKGIFSY